MNKASTYPPSLSRYLQPLPPSVVQRTGKVVCQLARPTNIQKIVNQRHNDVKWSHGKRKDPKNLFSYRKGNSPNNTDRFLREEYGARSGQRTLLPSLVCARLAVAPYYLLRRKLFTSYQDIKGDKHLQHQGNEQLLFFPQMDHRPWWKTHTWCVSWIHDSS